MILAQDAGMRSAWAAQKDSDAKMKQAGDGARLWPQHSYMEAEESVQGLDCPHKQVRGWRAQWLRVLAALGEDLSFIAPILGSSQLLFTLRPPQALYSHMKTTCTHTHA